jgi:hypothetical protein
MAIARQAKRYYWASLQDEHPLVGARHANYAAVLLDMLLALAPRTQIQSAAGIDWNEWREKVAVAQGKFDKAILKATGTTPPGFGIIKKCPTSAYRADRAKKDQRWCLFTSEGDRIIGRHPTKARALRQERAIQWRKQMGRLGQEPLLIQVADRSEPIEVKVTGHIDVDDSLFGLDGTSVAGLGWSDQQKRLSVGSLGLVLGGGIGAMAATRMNINPWFGLLALGLAGFGVAYTMSAPKEAPAGNQEAELIEPVVFRAPLGMAPPPWQGSSLF